jgi:hypothetical protein
VTTANTSFSSEEIARTFSIGMLMPRMDLGTIALMMYG